MSAMIEKVTSVIHTSEENADWKDNCVRPPKDNRVQTAVSLALHLSVSTLNFVLCRTSLRPRVGSYSDIYAASNFCVRS